MKMKNLFVAALMVLGCGLGAAVPAGAQENSGGQSTSATALYPTNLPTVKMTEAKVGDLMGEGESCMQHHWRKVRDLCCLECKTGCCPRYEGSEYAIDYWEPSALIEVSCRQGYSMMKPGLSGRGNTMIQSCIGFNKPGNSRYFFEARVWAINGYDGGLRHQAMGSVAGEKMRQCTEAKGDDTTKSDVWGYGANKWGFTLGAASGPGNSWEAYISDNDPSWAMDVGGTGSVPKQAPCEIGSVSIPNCWGPMGETGWVSHPNPRIAAALVAWRAHEKARKMKKVSEPAKGGYQMMMDFPFHKNSGPFGATMGLPDGGNKGSKCFKPGDSGPEWFDGKKPQEMQAFIKGLKQGDPSAVSDMNSGVYIFTVWVKTSCMRYRIPAGHPTPLCFYKDFS